MLTLQVAFTREIKPDWLSRKIMEKLRTNFSHVFFIYKESVFHATGKGVHSVPLAEYLKTHYIVDQYDVDFPNVSEDFFLGYTAGAAGKEYSSSQYLGFLFPKLQKFVTNGSEKEICSELVTKFIRDYKPCKLPKEPDFMSPLDAQILCKSFIK